ncbi:CLUMA_CG009876, isoform A [Clunio marinus]|uniref:Tonsoku-like protein n=1 Tax=Clunio marinus TaxID=568069 RepID=A0A1J1I8L4_9DIPT|nr:CLUMA_CG009876, isoform A [Clunio marinus]
MELNKLIRKKERAEDENNQQMVAEMCHKLGDHYINESKFMDALKEFRQESIIWQSLDKKMEYGRANRMIGEVYMLLEQFDDALKFVNLYQKIAKHENNLVEMQRAYATIGRCYLLKGDSESIESTESSNKGSYIKSAEKSFLKSLIISKELGRSVSKWELADMQARLYLNLGIVKEQLQESDEAISFYETAIKLSSSNDLHELHHKCLMNLSLLHSLREEESVIALSLLHSALEAAKRLSDKNEKVCETLLLKSNLLIKNGDYQSAKQALKKAFRMKSSNINDSETIEKNLRIVVILCKCEDELIITNSYDYSKRKELFEKLGDLSCKLKNFSKAIEFYLKTLEVAKLNGEGERQLIPIYVSLYQTYIDLKQYDKALEFVRMEYEVIKDEPKEACTTLIGMGNILDLAGKDFWNIDTTYRKALKEARKLDDNQAMEKNVLQKLVKLCKKRNMINLAELLEQEAAEKAITLSDYNEESEYSEDIIEINNEDNLELLLSSDAESSDTEQSRVTRTPGSATRSRRSAVPIKKNAKGETKLHEVCINGNYQLAKVLIEKGHALNVRDNAGWLPLHEAAINGHRDIVELLLDNGAQLAINDKGGTSCDGITPLYDAASNGNLSIVQLLLDRGAKATVKTDFNETPFDALVRWYDEYGRKLSSTEKEFYDEIKQRLQEQCERVGIDTTATKHPQTGSSGYQSAHSRSSQSSFNQRRYSKRNESIDEESTKENEDDACIEYKNVMKRLKHPSKENRHAIVETNEMKKRSAHLTVQDVDDDEWLDDDLKPTKKKQKTFNENSFGSPEKQLKSGKSLTRKSSSLLIDSDSEDVEIFASPKVSDAFDLVMNADTSKKSKRRNSSSKLPKSLSCQPSVLDAGFARFVEFNSNHKSPSKSPLKSSHHSFSNESSFNRPPQGEKQLIIKVKVEDEKIIVPVNRDIIDDLKISWLAEETARRYYCLKGIRPELKLKTFDGATLLHSDPVSLILSLANENLIDSEILDWKLPSLANRYLEACSEFKCPVDSDLNELLDFNPSAIHLDLSNQNFNSTNVKAVFKALQHQTSLLHLDLSSNFLQNDGIKLLSNTLTTLRQLNVLDLSGNLITDNGVEIMWNAMLKSKNPSEIRQLKLNFNPINSSSLRFISKICQCKNVISLSLVACGLTDAKCLEQLSSVKSLDIGYNKLTVDGLKGFLKRINPGIIETLNFERCTTETDIGDALVQFINTGCCISLKEINFAGMNFNENEILDLLRSLDKCEHLKSLDLSHQKQLTFLSLKYILFSMDSQSLERIKLIGCMNLHNLSNIFNLQHVERERRCHLKNIQLSMPISSGEYGTRNKFKEKMKEIWDIVTIYKGNVDNDSKLLYLIQNDEQ